MVLDKHENKENEDLIQEQSNNEEEWDALFSEEVDEEWEREKEVRRKRRSLIIKIVGTLLVLSLVVSGIQVWFHVFNLPSIEFTKVSEKLSEQKIIQDYKQAVVLIETDNSRGTGFNITQDGLIVTNEHVVDDYKRVFVYFEEKGVYVGNVIAAYPELDLAIVDIDGKDLPDLPLSFEEEWKERFGEDIVFVGNPLSHSQIANEGVLTGEVQLDDWDVPVMEITAPVYKGNSGSPVISEDGKVIGVIFATLNNRTGENGEIIAVAVPSIHIKDILEEIELNNRGGK